MDENLLNRIKDEYAVKAEYVNWDQFHVVNSRNYDLIDLAIKEILNEYLKLTNINS